MQAVEGLSLRGIWGGGAFRGVCRAPWFRAQRAPAFGPGTQAGSAPVGGEGKCHLSAMHGVKAGRGVRGVAAPRAAPSRCPDFSGAHERSFGSARARPGFRPERRRKGAQARAAAKPLTPAPLRGRGTRCARGDPHKPSAPHNPPTKNKPLREIPQRPYK